MSQNPGPRQPPPRNPNAGPSSSQAPGGASYHPNGYGTSEALRRARRPYAVRNTLLGLGIVSFMGGVYWWSIAKVKQDDFSDITPSAVSNNVNRAEDHLHNNSEAVQQKFRQASNQAKEQLNSASDTADKEFKDLRNKFEKERANLESSAAKGNERAKEALTSTKDELDRLASRTKQEASQWTDKTRAEADRLASRSKESLDSFGHSAKQNANSLSDSAQASFSDVRANAEKAWNKTRDSTQENVINPARAHLESVRDAVPVTAAELNEGFKSRFLHAEGRQWEEYWALEGRKRRAFLLEQRDGHLPTPGSTIG